MTAGAVPEGGYWRTEPETGMRARLRDPEGAWLPHHRGLRTDYITSVNKGCCGGAGPKLVTRTLAAAVAEALDAL